MTQDEFNELVELLREDWVIGNYDRVSQLICEDVYGAGTFQIVVPTLELIQQAYFPATSFSTKELAIRRALALLALFNPDALELKMSKYFYCVTVFTAWDNSRVMFVSTDLNECINVVKDNVSDICEYFYKYCIIERFEFGFVYANISKIINKYTWKDTKWVDTSEIVDNEINSDTYNFSLGLRIDVG